MNTEEKINLGSFFTPDFLVKKTYGLLEKHVDIKNYTFLDSSCGNGDFFIKNLKYIGADIYNYKLSSIKEKKINIINCNSLENVSRDKFNIQKNENLIIIGNPPYNDITSFYKNNIKNKSSIQIDKNLKSRDYGISFLKSYEILDANYICVLHPLSYLIKRTNFNALKKFKEKYILLDSIVVPSNYFVNKNKITFPIIIALYKRNNDGMNFEYINNFTFKTIENNKFKINNFTFINNFICKYPNHNHDNILPVAYFFPLRDINALRRNATFLSKETKNSIKIFKHNLKYYIYIHFFKKNIDLVPYYLGNCDIMIDINKFKFFENYFISEFTNKNNNPSIIRNYFINFFKDIL